jgi:hypothetical protein
VADRTGKLGSTPDSTGNMRPKPVSIRSSYLKVEMRSLNKVVSKRVHYRGAGTERMSNYKVTTYQVRERILMKCFYIMVSVAEGRIPVPGTGR